MEEFKKRAMDAIDKATSPMGNNYMGTLSNELKGFPEQEINALIEEFNLKSRYEEVEIAEVVTELRLNHFNKLWS